MKCQETKHLLSEYIDNELPATVRTEIKRHLDGCEACRAEHLAIAAAWADIDALPSLTPEPGFVSRFWTKAASRPSLAEKCLAFVRSIVHSARFVPVATALCLMVIVGSFNLVQVHHATSEDAEIIENIDLAEHLDVVKDLDLLQDMEVIQDLDHLKS